MEKTYVLRLIRECCKFKGDIPIDTWVLEIEHLSKAVVESRKEGLRELDILKALSGYLPFLPLNRRSSLLRSVLSGMCLEGSLLGEAKEIISKFSPSSIPGELLRENFSNPSLRETNLGWLIQNPMVRLVEGSGESTLCFLSSNNYQFAPYQLLEGMSVATAYIVPSLIDVRKDLVEFGIYPTYWSVKVKDLVLVRETEILDWDGRLKTTLALVVKSNSPWIDRDGCRRLKLWRKIVRD